jgi:hypothetical protein
MVLGGDLNGIGSQDNEYSHINNVKIYGEDRFGDQNFHNKSQDSVFQDYVEENVEDSKVAAKESPLPLTVNEENYRHKMEEYAKMENIAEKLDSKVTKKQQC